MSPAMSFVLRFLRHFLALICLVTETKRTSRIIGLLCLCVCEGQTPNDRAEGTIDKDDDANTVCHGLLKVLDYFTITEINVLVD